MGSKSIFQLKTDRFWWVDALFYFTVSLLIATIFSYVMFLVKNDIQRSEIEEHEALLKDIGTKQQKEYEKVVLSYQKKLKDFSILFENHEFASRSFEFMQEQTIPEVWFKQFNLERKSGKIQLFGEANSMEYFSKQVAIFEGNLYVKDVRGLNSGLGDSASVSFNINLDMSPELFSYVSESRAGESSLADVVTSSSANVFEVSGSESEKKINVFDILLSPEVIGEIDQANRAIKIDAPYGTDVAHLTPYIITSPETSVLPGSSVVQNFTNPVVYKVTARDGSTQEYTVKVNVLPQEQGETNRYVLIYIYVALGAVAIVSLIIMSAVFIKKLKRKKENEA